MFVKRRPGAPAGFFEVESAGLAWLAEAEPSGGPQIARAVCGTADSITLERLETRSTLPGAADHRRFGSALAHLHDCGAAWFGCPPGLWHADGFIGPLPLQHVHDPAAPAALDWGTFYARHRLAPFADAAERCGALDASAARVVRSIRQRLESGDATLTGPAEPPARLHGDLWSGNIVWTTRGGVLIDPAAHGGHRETDLAMLALFGQRGIDEILAGYQSVHALAPGWRQRVALHQLHPLLVHAALFGAGYGAQAAAAARSLA